MKKLFSVVAFCILCLPFAVSAQIYQGQLTGSVEGSFLAKVDGDQIRLLMWDNNKKTGAGAIADLNLQGGFSKISQADVRFSGTVGQDKITVTIINSDDLTVEATANAVPSEDLSRFTGRNYSFSDIEFQVGKTTPGVMDGEFTHFFGGKKDKLHGLLGSDGLFIAMGADGIIIVRGYFNSAGVSGDWVDSRKPESNNGSFSSHASSSSSSSSSGCFLGNLK
ncbi:hypothetical protein [Desulfobotulus mexicanus]|uniref:Uncharacterized protein n=1 Tax=Desulfobotulus mexicanus TaxID=2586642 RepID=A0A5Q4VG90_9BACT|nr:hypothetical protein [Desulfobotulus mexicanus]TYT75958.1 hypothetical protein FIM25_03430 [Desulfobotulus mexicanus]